MLGVCVQQQFTANGKLKQDRVGQVSSSDVSIIGGGARAAIDSELAIRRLGKDAINQSMRCDAMRCDGDGEMVV